jgi:hypothetical protein
VRRVLNLAEDRRVLERVCDRLRSASDTRLARLDDRLPAGSVAAEAHALAVWAAAAQGIEHRVPRLHPLASADQLAVVGQDLLDWLDSGQGGPPVLNAWRERVQQLKAAI